MMYKKLSDLTLNKEHKELQKILYPTKNCERFSMLRVFFRQQRQNLNQKIQKMKLDLFLIVKL